MFNQLLLVALGKRPGLTRAPERWEWEQIFLNAKRQGLQGVLWKTVSSLPESQLPPEPILSQWRSRAETIVILNDTHYNHCRELTEWLDSRGLENCILKGQGFSLLYPEQGLRLCGDVDVWIPAGRRNVLNTFRYGGFEFYEVLNRECKVDFFPVVSLDVHFQPTRMFNPVLDRRLRRFCNEEASKGFSMTESGFKVPSRLFNAVYCVVHIFHHVIDGGAGLRQMMDLYYILQNLPSEQKGEASEALCSFGLKNFASAAMYVLSEVFELEQEYLLFPPDRERGEKLLDDILSKGRVAVHPSRRHRLNNFNKRLAVTMRFTFDYPREVLWAPVYKVWHFCWRGVQGYL